MHISDKRALACLYMFATNMQTNKGDPTSYLAVLIYTTYTDDNNRSIHTIVY